MQTETSFLDSISGFAVTPLDPGHPSALQCSCPRGKGTLRKHLLYYPTAPSQGISTFLLLQALPIFLDKLLSPVLAVVLSVTAVLLVGMSVNSGITACNSMLKEFVQKFQLLLCWMFKHQQYAQLLLYTQAFNMCHTC